MSIGSVLLGYLDTPAAVGQFGVAQKVPLALLGIAQLWSSTLDPQVAKMMGERRDELRAQASLFSSLSAPSRCRWPRAPWVIGPDLIRALFGSQFAPAGRASVPMVLALALALVSYNVSSVLAAGGDERRYALGRSLAAGACLGAVGPEGCARRCPAEACASPKRRRRRRRWPRCTRPPAGQAMLSLP